jgi:hypothetical protein
MAFTLGIYSKQNKLAKIISYYSCWFTKACDEKGMRQKWHAELQGIV